MINHVHRTPPDGSLAWIRTYADSAEPTLPTDWSRMTPAELTAWLTPAQTTREAARQAFAAAQTADAAEDATRRQRVVDGLSTLESMLDTDPANLAQAGNQLRVIKRALHWLVRRELKRG